MDISGEVPYSYATEETWFPRDNLVEVSKLMILQRIHNLCGKWKIGESWSSLSLFHLTFAICLKRK